MAQEFFDHVHLSGLWDAKEARWRAALREAIEAGADVITATEFTQTPLEAPKGWGLIRYSGLGRNECAIFYRKAVFWARDHWCIPISKTPYALGSGKIRPRTHLLGAELIFAPDGEPGKIVNVEVFHAPSAIEGRNGLIRGARRVKAALECFSATSKHRRTELKGEATVVAADWNLSLRKAWVRALLNAQMPGLRNAWHRLPKTGTHGKTRVIDGVRHTRSLVTAAGTRILARVAGFDHRMIITRFRWRR